MVCLLKPVPTGNQGSVIGKVNPTECENLRRETCWKRRKLYKKEANSKIKRNQLVDRNKAEKKPQKTNVIHRPIELREKRYNIGFYLSNIK